MVLSTFPSCTRAANGATEGNRASAGLPQKWSTHEPPNDKHVSAAFAGFAGFGPCVYGRRTRQSRARPYLSILPTTGLIASVTFFY